MKTNKCYFAIDLQLERKCSVLKSVGNSAVAVLLAAFVLLTLGFAGSQELHGYLHHDADGPGHHCVITLFSQGLVDASDAAIIPARFTAQVSPMIFPATEPEITSLDFLLLPGRAPPLVLS